MSSSSSSSNGGVGFIGLLTIVFITLKLLGKINWSWWWVLSPLWIAFSIFMAGVIIFIFGAIFHYLWKNRKKNKDN
jgi:ABC-type antimicrobial peptide transport system permease subunit